MGDAEQDSPGESPASSIIEPAAADPPYADPAQDAPQQLAANPAAKPHTASLAEQARALYRKSATFQMRNITTNVCIVSAPVLFCILLLLLQVGVQKLMSGSEFQCGCQCTKCCFGGDSSNCTVMHDTSCPYTCLAYNSSNCGLQFSVGTQVAFCNISYPTAWPAVVQTPKDEERAAIHRPKVTMLYTRGSNATLSEQLTSGLLQPPAVQASTLLAAQQYLTEFTALQMPATTIPGELFALLGLQRLGTSSIVTEAAGLYLETALASKSKSLYMLWPDGTCRQLGLQAAVNTSLITALQAMVNASNTPMAAALLNSRISSLSSSAAGSNSAAMAQVASVSVNCTDVVFQAVPSPKHLQRALYCGNHLAACNHKKVTNSFAAAFDWSNTSLKAFAPVLYYNDTYGKPDDDTAVGARYMRQPQLLNMAVNSWLARLLGPTSSAELLAVAALPREATPKDLDWTPVLGPVLATWILQVLLPIFVSQLVYEKENLLRMVMKMHGLQDGAYWLVQYSWFLLVYVIYATSFLIFGTITKLSLFTLNSYGIQICLLFIWGNAMIAMSLLISCFFTSTRTATIFCYFYVFAMGLIGYLMMRFLLDLQGQVPWVDALQVLPPLALYRGLYELGAYAKLATQRGEFGMTPANLHGDYNGMLSVWWMLVVEWVAMMLLAWYLEQVYASGTGNQRTPLFFLDWFRRRKQQQQQGMAVQHAHKDHIHIVASSTESSLPVSYALSPIKSSGFKAVFSRSSPVRVMPIHTHVLHTLGVAQTQQLQPSAASFDPSPSPSTASAAAAAADAACVLEPADVAAERLRTAAVDDYEEHPLVIRALHKVYPGQDGQPPKLAVRRLDLAVAKGECFGLLGPNGAGKSTSISMLVGLQQPSAGTAIIGGHELAAGMRPIYSIMGLCPQHDLLWGTLSGREHLTFYGTLKGMSGPALAAEVEKCLKAVKLWANGVADKPSGSYSGGMKRRLSVAISLMGSPKVVYLDEPSTGLDPASRRVLWDVIKAAKPGRSIILTTHNMEEAEVLCDRLGIFVSGRLACIGHPKDITSRFCGFLVLTISVPADREGEAQHLVLELAAGARLTYNVGGTLKYELPTDQVSLSRVFSTMAGLRAAELGVMDWAVASATMEEVFIRITQQMDLKATD